MARRGISLLDLAMPAPGAQALLPEQVAGHLENLAVVEHRSTTSAGTFVHEGVVQPISDLGFPALNSWPVEVPGLNTGLRFRLVRRRAVPDAGDTLEPAGEELFLDLFVDRIAITVPGLRAAVLVPSTAGTANVAHLRPDPARSAVKITGGGVVRIDLSGGDSTVRFIDWPDPFDPAAPSGAVVRVSFEPIHFLIGDSSVGFTVDRLVYDASEQVTPPEVVARGQTPAWQGIAIAEATCYLPPNAPLVEDVNVGVRDVILGSPAGLQGEIRVELGRTPVNPDLVEFLQDVDGDLQTRPVDGSGLSLGVPFVAGTGDTARMRARIPQATASTPAQPRATWLLPDGTRIPDAIDTSWFTADAGETLKSVPSELVDGERLAANEVRYTFREEAADPQHAPTVSVDLDGTTAANVVAAAGTAEALGALTFTADLTGGVSADDLRWRLGTGPDAQTAGGATFTPRLSATPAAHDLVLTDADDHTRRIRLEVLAEGDLVVGTAAGPRDATGAVLDVRGVAETHGLAAFHRDGTLDGSGEDATLASGVVTVPEGALAEVTLELGAGVEPDDPPADPVTTEPVRHLQVEMVFNDDVVLGWGDARLPEPFSVAALQAWADGFDGAQIVVIGRCCDIGTAARNDELAGQRAAEAAGWFAGHTVHQRGEQDAPSAAMAAQQALVTPPLSTAESSAAWLVKEEHSDTERASWGESTTRAPRPDYRRVDVYAVGGTVAAGAEPPMTTGEERALAPDHRRSLVPGADATALELPGVREPSLPFLLRLVVRWDSPTVTEWADAIPTQAELTFEWASTNVTLPTGDDVRPRAPGEPPGTPSTEVFTLTGRWSYDARSGQTVFSVSLASAGDPEGLAAFDGEVIAVAMALAPALLAGIGAAGIDGAAVRLAALAVASGFLATVAKDGEVVIHAVEVEHRQLALGELSGSRTRILFDYTAAIGFDITADGIGGIATDDGAPLKVRYKGVGLEIDDSATEWHEKVGLVFEDVSFEVADPGRWTIEGPLGELLQVTATRAGVGSTWFECDLEFALDLGVVAITGATVRVVFDDPDVSAELRGLGVRVSIPGVLSGAGRVSLGDGGAFKAALELTIDAIQAKGMGSLAFDPATDFVAIGAGLLLPVGIPLGSTGLGLFGFLGQFVSNGRRALPSGFDDDPVGREVAWYRDVNPEDKYEPERGQWALGLGAIVGTLPDTAFTFNATGMLVVAFPDPAVVFGIDAKLIQQPQVTPSEQGSSPTGGLEILGLVAVDDEAVMVGVRGRYLLPKVLDFRLPIDGYFPYPSTPRDAFVRIGADGFEGRGGDPVTITFLPDTIDVSAWSYLMVEARELHNLGGDDRFDFDGFSIGFGAGWEIRWSAGPIKLEASAKVLVGLGTDPFLLKGGVFVRGELSLVVCSISATGELIATVWDDGGIKVNLEGRFCGKVSLFFFSIEGCVGIEIGDPITPEAPPPPPPVGKVSLTDRRGFTTALAVTGTPGPEETVWPDTVPVLEFTHHLEDALDTAGAFSPPPPPAGPAWHGTSELKYAYRLTRVELVPSGGAPLAGPLDAAWWLPTNRPGILADGDVAVSPEEGLWLALLAWDPAPWTYWLPDGGAGTDADPADVPGRLCEPPTRPRRSCVLGRLGVRTGVDAVRLRNGGPSGPPFPSRWEVLGRESVGGVLVGDLAPHLAARGLSLDPGHVGASPFGEDVWWLARLLDRGLPLMTTALDGRVVGDVTDAEVWLVVCTDKRRPPPHEGLPGGGQPPGGGDRLQCEHTAQLDRDAGVDLGRRFTLGRLLLTALGGSFLTQQGPPTGALSVRFPDEGFRIRLPEAAAVVRVGVVLFHSPVEVLAHDANGTVVDAEKSPREQGVRHVVEVRGAGITDVVVRFGGNEAQLTDVCWLATDREQPDTGPIDRPGGTTALPEVSGRRLGEAVHEPWVAEVEDEADSRYGSCLLVRYRPRRDGTWTDLRVAEWRGVRDTAGRVGVLRACGVSREAAEQADANADAAAGLAAEITDRATGDVPAHRHLLAANTTYEVRIAWQWKAWVKTDDQPSPPPTTTGTWTDGAVVTRRFRTAADVGDVGTSPPPADLVDERAFDPRGIARYLLGFEPDTGDAPHLRDDPLRVHLAVDHLGQLAGLYGRDITLRLRRTDPPPGSTAGLAHPPDLPLVIEWLPLVDDQRPLGQRRFLEGIREAPCLPEPPLGGTTGEVRAPLEPGAAYDLMLVAPPTADPDAEQVLVGRSHFRASRYADVPDLLAALGFTAPTPRPILANDAIVAVSVPGGPLQVDDAALDTALAALGLDPWPLPVTPRTTVLWLDDAGGWRLAGVLLETDEPLHREGRVALEVTSLRYGPTTLAPVRRNTAGTRLLFAPPAPTAVTGDVIVELSVTRRDTDRTGAVTATVHGGTREGIDRPRMAYQEAGT